MVYVVFILFLLFTIYTVTRRYWLISTYIVGVYTFMMLFAIVLARNYTFYADYSYENYFSSSLFGLLMMFYFIPFFKEKPEIIHDDSEEFLLRFTRVGYVTSAIIILGMILLFPSVLKAFATGLGAVRKSMYFGDTAHIIRGFWGNVGQRILSKFGWIGYSNLLMFFYAMIYIPKKVPLKILLIISSLGPVWLGMLNGGRTYTVYWVIYLFFCILLFYKEMTFKRKHQIFILLAIVVIFVMRYFIMATGERVSMNRNYSTSNEFLMLYTGQPFANFNYYFSGIKWHPYTFRRELPLLTSMIFGRLNLTDYRALIQSHTGILPSSFSTFLGTIYVDTGIIGMVLYTAVYFFTARRFMKRKAFDLAHLIYIGIICQIPLTGVFYHSFYKSDITIQIIILVFLCRYMDLDKKTLFLKIGHSKSIKL